MRKTCVLFLFVFLLSGCGAQETFETISDEIISPVMAQPREVSVRLPDNAVAPVLETDSQQIYISDDYEIVVEKRSSGDLNATVQALSGYERDQLTLLETQKGDVTRYDFVWVSTGERGDRLGRAVILDDGNYHYCMSALRDAASAEKSQIVWSDVFQSFTLV